MLHILQVDRAGAPIDWLRPKEAAKLEASGKVTWGLGEPCMVFRGGTNSRTGLPSLLPIRPIISVIGTGFKAQSHKTPSVSGALVFRRDKLICAYCGLQFKEEELTIDHIQPKSRKGEDSWTNYASSCKFCNSKKADRTPEEAKMPLLYVPYVPNIHETFILRNKTIIADQMEFLLHSVSKNSRLRC
jgi:5-methylcytosine-specific restriction endonuclease McrA